MREICASGSVGGEGGNALAYPATWPPERGGLPRSSVEASVMLVERRGQAIAIWLGSTGVGSNRHQEKPDVQWKAAAFVRWHEPDDARVSSPDL